MNRRLFLTSTSALAVLGLAGLPAAASDVTEYTPGVIDAALSEGKTVLVRYGAKWCSTCARQERVISSLREENPSYDEAIMFVHVDWDQFRDHEVTVGRNVPRRSTLILLRGEEELARIVAGTSQTQIKALMDQGISSGT